MARTSTTTYTYTCDRCGFEKETDGRTWGHVTSPSQWRRYWQKHDSFERPQALDLCPSCVQSFTFDWMAAG